MAPNMILTWDPLCEFIFPSWRTETWEQFAFALLLTFIFAIGSTLYHPLVLMKLLKNEKRRFMQTLAFAGQYLIKLIVMFLLMTMNVYVALVIALGVSLGYAFVPRIISKMTKKQSYSNQQRNDSK